MTSTAAAALYIPPLGDHLNSVSPAKPCTRLTLPDHRQHEWRTEYLGDLPEAAYYHPAAVLHLHGNGVGHHLPLNPVAWTLASAWRGFQLDYILVGHAVITGNEDHDGNLTPLPAQFTAQTEKAIAAATAWWCDNSFHLPHWPYTLDSPAFGPAIAATHQAL
ncbi:hypothetical protein OG705_29110 [Streptomyces sp. NBC_00838]|uniref:hypothetical protein n=1 Tax=Streptomyces sp. NBC_00838 TaxID=2903680 RepID=UPI003865B2E7|nr:hypothetical protein OG705_29110 [Streptomyces sp. NBC_00838]